MTGKVLIVDGWQVAELLFSFTFASAARKVTTTLWKCPSFALDKHGSEGVVAVCEVGFPERGTTLLRDVHSPTVKCCLNRYEGLPSAPPRPCLASMVMRDASAALAT